MAVMDIHMVSGYYPDKDGLAELENDIDLGKPTTTAPPKKIQNVPDVMRLVKPTCHYRHG